MKCGRVSMKSSYGNIKYNHCDMFDKYHLTLKVPSIYISIEKKEEENFGISCMVLWWFYGSTKLKYNYCDMPVITQITAEVPSI